MSTSSLALQNSKYVYEFITNNLHPSIQLETSTQLDTWKTPLEAVSYLQKLISLALRKDLEVERQHQIMPQIGMKIGDSV